MLLRRNPPWWYGGDTVTLYHGTSSAFLDEIDEHGLVAKDMDEYLFDLVDFYCTVSGREWTPQMQAQADETVYNYRKWQGGTDAIFSTVSFNRASSYAQSYRLYGGEAGYQIFLLFGGVEPRREKYLGRSAVPPVFPEAYPIVIEMEVPRGMILNVAERQDGNFPTDLSGWRKRHAEYGRGAPFDEWMARESDYEVRVQGPVPPEMITKVHVPDPQT